MKLETVRTIARKARRDLERPGDVKRRIAIGALSLAAVAAMSPLGFDSERVTRTTEAFGFAIPVGLIVLGSHALDIPLAIAGGGSDRWRRRPGLAVFVAVKAAADAAGAVNYTSIAAAAVSVAILALSLPEAWAALFRRRSGV